MIWLVGFLAIVAVVAALVGLVGAKRELVALRNELEVDHQTFEARQQLLDVRLDRLQQEQVAMQSVLQRDVVDGEVVEDNIVDGELVEDDIAVGEFDDDNQGFADGETQDSTGECEVKRSDLVEDPLSRSAPVVDMQENRIDLAGSSFSFKRMSEVWLVSRIAGDGYAHLGSTLLLNHALPVTDVASTIDFFDDRGVLQTLQVPPDFVTVGAACQPVRTVDMAPTGEGYWLLAGGEFAIAGAWIPAHIGSSSNWDTKIGAELDSIVHHALPGLATGFACEALVDKIALDEVGVVVATAGNSNPDRDMVMGSLACSRDLVSVTDAAGRPLEQAWESATVSLWQSSDPALLVVDRNGVPLLRVEI